MGSNKTVEIASEDTDLAEIRSQIQNKLTAPERQACLEAVEFILGVREDNFVDFANIEQNLPTEALPVDLQVDGEQSLEDVLREMQDDSGRDVYTESQTEALVTLNRYMLRPKKESFREAAVAVQQEAIENGDSLVVTHPSEY